MFEPWIRSFDSAAGACIGACAEYVEVASAMMERGAIEGHQLGGVPGSLVGGTLGWAYGGVVGAMSGLAHGAMVGAQHFAESKHHQATKAPHVKPPLA
jgi:hypothetical protein